MDTPTARADTDVLDALAALPQPLDNFRLLPTCAVCQVLSTMPATSAWNESIRRHAIEEHPDRVSDLHLYLHHG